ncbi:MAG: hypothetical protein U0L68_08950 [Prevotellamassilia sp.]|nr:hypothetical protein [Prevotellamassilia sp.]
MKHLFHTWCRLVMLVALCGFASMQAAAQSTDEPIITLYTNAYQNDGANNYIQLCLGSNVESDYIDVDAGFGREVHELVPAQLDPNTQEWTGTVMTLTVSSEGIVRIYGDPSHINLIDAHGCALRRIECSQLTGLSILDLSHNELEALDLTPFQQLAAVYVNDNTFHVQPLKVGTPKDNLLILEMQSVKSLDPSFNLSDYPNLVTFDAWNASGLQRVDPTGCPKLQRLSIDSTPVSSLDVSQNANLVILNISETAIRNVDLSHNPKLQQFYADHMSGSINAGVKLEKLDVSHNTELVHLFAAGNGFTSVDLSKNINLFNLYLANNSLSSIDLSHNANLYNVILRNNNFDFATLPLPNDEWGQYDYVPNQMPVARSFKVGDVLDLSSRVLREGTTTTCAVFRLSDADPSVREPLGDEEYTYADGKITFLKAMSDSLYVAFANSAFPDLSLDGQSLRTTKFVVKTAEEYGRPNLALTLTLPTASTSEPIAFAVGMRDATAAAPKTFYLDLGDGNLKPYTATTHGTPATQNVSGVTPQGVVKVYVPDGEDVTAFAMHGVALAAADFGPSHQLTELTLTDAGLKSIDLSWNRSLHRLELTGNHFGTLNIRGANDAFQKTVLTDINLSRNELTAVTLNDNYTIHHLDLSHNKLTELSFKDGDMLETVNLQDNLLTTLNFSYSTLMTTLNVADNLLTSIYIPEDNALTTLRVENNHLHFGTLPQIPGLTTFSYAPQKPVLIAQKGPGADLSAYNFNGQTTYTWRKATGEALNLGTDYTCEGGKTHFLEPIHGTKVYGEMRHVAFPALTLTTTEIEAAGMPTHELASFTTTADAEGTLILVASEPNSTVCIDWGGEGLELEQYVVGTSVTTFNVTARKGATARVYSYADADNLTVFSMRGVKVGTMDASQMKNLTALTVEDAGMTAITLPDNDKLAELTLEGNQLTGIDLSAYPNLMMLSLGSNQLESFDASILPNLQLLNVSSNKLTSLTLNNPQLWSLAANGNALTEVDITRLPALHQAALSENQLSALDISQNSDLSVLFLDHNRFRLSTLPISSKFSLYTHANQEALSVEAVQGDVDLSSEAVIDGTPTTYRWFVNMPYFDEYGELAGEELILDKEYRVANGVTTFLTPIEGVVCAMTNEKFPNFVLYTTEMDILEAPASVHNVQSAAEGMQVSVADGTLLVTLAQPAVFTVVSANGSLLHTVQAAAGTTRVAGLQPGVYVVSTAGASVKAVVR